MVPSAVWTILCMNGWHWVSVAREVQLLSKGCMSGNLSEHSCLFCWVGIGKLRAQRPRDVWLVLEPSFLNNLPELQDLSACLEKPTAAILSTNGFICKKSPSPGNPSFHVWLLFLYIGGMTWLCSLFQLLTFWILLIMVPNKLQAVIGKFVSPSTAVPNALQSCLSSDDTLVGGGGVWHWANNFRCPRLFVVTVNNATPSLLP